MRIAFSIILIFVATSAIGVASLERGFWNPTEQEILARYTVPASKFIDIDGIRIHYEDQGTGPVLVLTQRLGIERLAIGGSSWGGTIAYSFAAAHPDRVSALILISTPGMRSTRSDFHLWAATSAFGRWRSRYYQTPDDLAATMRSVSVDTAYLTPALVRQYADFLNRRGRAHERALKLEQILADEASDRAHAVVAGITAPTLVVWGRDNPAYAPENAADFATAMVHSSKVVTRIYPGVGHKVEREAPVPLAADIDSFLADYH